MYKACVLFKRTVPLSDPKEEEEEEEEEEQQQQQQRIIRNIILSKLNATFESKCTFIPKNKNMFNTFLVQHRVSSYTRTKPHIKQAFTNFKKISCYNSRYIIKTTGKDLSDLYIYISLIFSQELKSLETEELQHVLYLRPLLSLAISIHDV